MAEFGALQDRFTELMQGTLDVYKRQGQNGAEAALAFQALLSCIRQVTDAQAGINADSLLRFESACQALNISLQETKNGVTSLRDPMEVLQELSAAYSKLGENDSRTTDLLDSVGGGLSADRLDALLGQWDTYETMLGQFETGAGSLARCV